MGKLQIYKASAGSGKTHLLTEFYLKLAFERPDNFKTILAVTFTNKAADEMKNRIILKISDIIDKKDKADHFFEIKESLKCSDNELVERAVAVRKNILHNYTNFKVGTIDSFIQRIIRAFTFELNLSSGYDIEFDTGKVTSDLTELLLNRIPEDPELKDWLINLLDDKISSGESYDFRKEIEDLTKELFKEEFQKLNIKYLSGSDDQKREKKEVLTELKTLKHEFEHKMTGLSDDYKGVLKKFGVEVPGQRDTFSIISNLFIKKIPEKNYETNITIIKALNGPENWYAKSAKKELISMIMSVYPELSVILGTFFRIIQEEGEMYYSTVSILKQFYAFGIIDDTSKLLPDYRNDNNLLLMSDITLFLKEIIGKNDAPFIYEKAGNKYKYLLIDEFQDTSAFQWSNFKPLILNSLSQSYTNLIVGDVKQSVYRWRNGDWKLLLEGVKNDIGDDLVEEHTLTTNWRSKKNIVKFNNTVFSIIPNMLRQQFNRISSEVLQNEDINRENRLDKSRMITDAYSTAVQSVPDKPEKEGGKVYIKFFDSKLKNEDYVSALSEFFPQAIDALLKDGKYSPADIGILVRKNDDAEKTVLILNAYRKLHPDSFKYPVISPNSLKIVGSLAVKVLISAMKFINEPTDKLNLAELLFFYNSKKIEPIDDHTLFSSISENTYQDYLPEIFFTDDSLKNYETVYDLSIILIQIFGLNDWIDDFPYVRSLRELIANHSFNKNLSLSEFLEFWDEKGKETTIEMPESEDAVRIMTIHKSKGLAFKVVFVPFANWSIDNGPKGPLLWVKTDVPPLSDLGCFPIKYVTNLEKTIFKNEYLDEKMQAYMDALNMLYVALTRARNEIYIYAPVKKDRNDSVCSHIGQTLYQAMINTVEDEKPTSLDYIQPASYFKSENDEFCFEDNHTYDLKTQVQPSTGVPDAMPDLNTIEEYTFDWHSRLNIKYRSKDFFVESIKDIEEKVNHGILMHRLFSEIITPEDIQSVLQNMVFEGLITQHESIHLNQSVREVLKRPVVCDWFNETYEVKTEDALLTASGEIKIPDRVLISDDKVIVIDFKFGRKHEKYSEQISEYKHLLEQAYERKSEAYIYYVEEDIIESV